MRSKCFWFLAALGLSTCFATPAAQSAEVTIASGPPAAAQQEPLLEKTEPDAAVAFFELQTDERACFVGQSMELRLSFGIDASLADENLIQLFQRRMRVPVQIDAPWFGSLHCSTGWSTSEPVSAAEQPGFVLNGDPLNIQSVDPITRNGQSFRVFEYRVSFTPTCAGELLLPSASLRFAFAREFRSELLGRKTPIDRIDQRLVSLPLVLDVRPLPEVDRPLEFTDAVGQFSATASATPRTLKQGESLRLTATITGTGNLADFTPPRPIWAGFHLRGQTDRFESGRRLLTYDLAPLQTGPQLLSGFRFAYFDPTLGDYRTIETEELSIKALPSAASATQDHSRDSRKDSRPRTAPSFWTIAIGLLVGAGLLLWLRSWRRS